MTAMSLFAQPAGNELAPAGGTAKLGASEPLASSTALGGRERSAFQASMAIAWGQDAPLSSELRSTSRAAAADPTSALNVGCPAIASGRPDRGGGDPKTPSRGPLAGLPSTGVTWLAVPAAGGGLVGRIGQNLDRGMQPHTASGKVRPLLAIAKAQPADPTHEPVAVALDATPPMIGGVLPILAQPAETMPRVSAGTEPQALPVLTTSSAGDLPTNALGADETRTTAANSAPPPRVGPDDGGFARLGAHALADGLPAEATARPPGSTATPTLLSVAADARPRVEDVPVSALPDGRAPVEVARDCPAADGAMRPLPSPPGSTAVKSPSALAANVWPKAGDEAEPRIRIPVDTSFAQPRSAAAAVASSPPAVSAGATPLVAAPRPQPWSAQSDVRFGVAPSRPTRAVADGDTAAVRGNGGGATSHDWVAGNPNRIPDFTQNSGRDDVMQHGSVGLAPAAADPAQGQAAVAAHDALAGTVSAPVLADTPSQLAIARTSLWSAPVHVGTEVLVDGARLVPSPPESVPPAAQAGTPVPPATPDVPRAADGSPPRQPNAAFANRYSVGEPPGGQRLTQVPVEWPGTPAPAMPQASSRSLAETARDSAPPAAAQPIVAAPDARPQEPTVVLSPPLVTRSADMAPVPPAFQSDIRTTTEPRQGRAESRLDTPTVATITRVDPTLAPFPGAVAATVQTSSLPAGAIDLAVAAAAVPQVAQPLISLATKPGSGSVTVRLHPVELGQVEIRLERGAGGQTRLILRAERPETLRMLADQRPHLDAALARAGIAAGQRHISFDPAPAGGPESFAAVATRPSAAQSSSPSAWHQDGSSPSPAGNGGSAAAGPISAHGGSAVGTGQGSSFGSADGQTNANGGAYGGGPGGRRFVSSSAGDLPHARSGDTLVRAALDGDGVNITA